MVEPHESVEPKDSNEQQKSKENTLVRDEFFVKKTVIKVFSIFHIVSVGLALWVFMDLSSVMGKESLSGTLWEKMYTPVLTLGFFIAPFTILAVHVMGIVLLKRDGVLSRWWLANYIPLIIVLVPILFISSLWIPPIFTGIFMLIILLVPLWNFDW